MRVDRRKGSDALRTTRTYDPSTGWLTAIQSGSGNGIQNLHYTRDTLGQLLSREDQRPHEIDAVKYSMDVMKHAP